MSEIKSLENKMGSSQFHIDDQANNNNTSKIDIKSKNKYDTLETTNKLSISRKKAFWKIVVIGTVLLVITGVVLAIVLTLPSNDSPTPSPQKPQFD